MQLTRRNRAAVLALLLATGLAGAASAAPPVEKSQGDVRYITGGIGLDESQQLKAMESQYSIAITFAEHDSGKADYLADIPVTITDSHGQTVLALKSDGPYLLVKLAPGSYQVTASHGGVPKNSRVTVGPSSHTSQVSFDWR